MTRPGSLLAPLALTLLAACGDPPAGNASGAPTPTTTPAATAAATATAAAATTTASATATAASTGDAPAVAAAPSTPEPALKDWDAAKSDLTLIAGWDDAGCMARRIGAWVRVGCATSTTKKGAPTRITVKKGFAPGKFSILSERGGSTMLVFPFTEGLDAEATFEFADGAFTFTSKWPKGAPEPKQVGGFTEAALPDAAPTAEGDAPAPAASAAASAAPELEIASDPLPEEPKLEGAPSLDDWKTAREVGVKGSSAHACETKQSGDWFRAVCRANSATGKVTSAKATKGFDEKQGYVVVGQGSLVLVTRYTRGTDQAFEIAWERKAAELQLRWPEASTNPPNVRGELVAKP